MTHRFATRNLLLAVVLTLGVWLIPSALRAIGPPPPGPTDADCRLEHNPAYNQEDGLAPNDPNNRYDGIVCPLTTAQRASSLVVGTTTLRFPGGGEWQFPDNPRRATVSMNAVAIGVPAHLVITANTADAPGGGQTTVVDSQLTTSRSYAPPIRITEVGRGIEASTINVSFPPPDGAGTVYLTVERLSADPPPGAFVLEGRVSCAESGSVVVLDWTESVGADYYWVYQDSITIALKTRYETAHTQIGDDQRHTYSILAVNSFGTRSSNSVSLRTISNECPPGGVRVTVTPGDITLGTGETRQFTATVDQGGSFTRRIITFDDLPTAQEVTDQYAASFGTVFSSAQGSAYTYRNDSDCSTFANRGHSQGEAISPPNFLAPSVPGNFGPVYRIGDLIITFNNPVIDPSFYLLSVGYNPVTVTFFDVNNQIISSQVFVRGQDYPYGDPTRDALCEVDFVDVPDPSIRVKKITLFQNATDYNDGYGIDDLGYAVSESGPVQLTWRLTNHTLGSIGPIPSDSYVAIFQAGSQTGSFPGLVQAVARYAGADFIGSANVTITGGGGPEPPTVDLKVNGVEAATITEGESATLSWTSTNANTCTAVANPPRSDWTGPRAIAGTQPTSPSQNTTYTLDCFGDGGQATDSVTVTVRTRPRVEGDTLAHGTLHDLVIDDRSLVAASAFVNVAGGAVRLPNYRPVTETDYLGAAADLWDRVQRLRAEHERTLNEGTVSGLFNLNSLPTVSPTSGDSRDDWLRPEGSIWFREGDLTLDNVTFMGRGTIVVLGGNLTITGNLRYHQGVGRADSLGLMVITNENAGGNLTVAGSATNWVGATYVGGTATIAGTTGASSEFVGNLAAHTIAINRTNLRIVYDSRVAVVPPPGFDQPFFSRLRESY